MIHTIREKKPVIHKTAFVAWNAEVSGAVTLEAHASVWFSATLRADIAPIEIGEGSNIQDGSVIHVDTDIPCIIGNYVTVGHGAVLHSCTIGNEVLIGMGAIILDGAIIGTQSIVGAGALVTQGKIFPPRSLVLGTPAKVIRELTEDEVKKILHNSQYYVELACDAKNYYKEV
jgi:carbonic anhydrase/acetyltransferase-like protein (isoleucine patch superfamily)